MSAAMGMGTGNFKPSSEELQAIEKAMKDEKFCQLFQEYAQEISDPKNRKLYEEEIRKMETQAGNDVKFINPEPGFVVKTVLKSKGKKVFINICQSDMVEEPTMKTVTKDGKKGNMWSVPNSLTVHRDDVDKAGKMCMVYDVVFHPRALRLADADKQIRKMLIDTALDGIEQRFPAHKLDREELRFPKMKFKGMPQQSIIRESGGSKADTSVSSVGDPNPIEKLMGEFSETIKGSDKPGSKPSNTRPEHAPKYTIVHRGEVDMIDYRQSTDSTLSTRPKELVISIELPKCQSASPVELDIAEQSLSLECKDPGPYILKLPLPYPVDQDNGSAKFDKTKRTLIVTLPVIVPSSTVQSTVTDNTMKFNSPSDVKRSSAEVDVVGSTDVLTASSSDSGDQLIEIVADNSKVDEVPPTGRLSPPVVVDVDDANPSTLENGASEDSEWVEVPSALAITSRKVLDQMTYHQTDKVVSLQLQNRIDDSLRITECLLDFKERVFGPLKTHNVVLTVRGDNKSIPDTDAEAIAALHFSFDIEFNTLNCSIDNSGDVTVILLAKSLATEIQRMQVGLTSETLTERRFLTATNVEGVSDSKELWNCSVNGSKTTSVLESKTTSATEYLLTNNAKSPNQASKENSVETVMDGMKNMFTSKTYKPLVEDNLSELENESKIVELEDEDIEEAIPDFIAAEKFVASKRGYVFKQGSQGLGYYKDSDSTSDASKTSNHERDEGYGPLDDARLDRYKEATKHMDHNPPKFQPPGTNPPPPAGEESILLSNSYIDELE